MMVHELISYCHIFTSTSLRIPWPTEYSVDVYHFLCLWTNLGPQRCVKVFWGTG